MASSKLKQIIEQNDTGAGKIFDLFIQCLIVFSLVCFSVETLPNLSSAFRAALGAIEAISVAIFTIEYLLRLMVADKKLSFIFSFYGIIDILAILPFYITTSIDLRSIRVFRLFRLARMFKLIRYSKAIKRLGNAFRSIKEELIVFFTASCFLIYFAGVGVYYFENPTQPEHFSSVFHSLWWAVITLTTVGYGDIYPVTVGGKVFTFCILMVGLGIAAVPAGLLASALTSALKDEDKGQG
jgi:voltage-gated potassium channel